MTKLIAQITAIVFILTVTMARATTIQTYGPFDVTFYNNGEGYEIEGYPADEFKGQQDWTSEQMSDVGSAIDAWDSYITDTPGRQIKVHMFWYEFGNNNTMGSSFSPSNGDFTTSWTYPEHIWRDGANYNGPWTNFDIVVWFDPTAAGASWNFGSDAPASFELDFRSIMTHDIGHHIGFIDTYDDYDDSFGNTWGTATDPYAWLGYNGLSEWDKNLVDSLGYRPVNGLPPHPTDNFDEADDPVFWDGANAVNYHGGNVPIYAPTPFSSGSSLSHLDYATFSNSLMSPFIGTGEMTRMVSDLEWAVMKDMGWSVVPEPSTIILFALGVLPLLRKRTA
ncbi:MAG: PEP-CTERM sorting domain-containing protein [Planctomycetota bacterium]